MIPNAVVITTSMNMSMDTSMGMNMHTSINMSINTGTTIMPTRYLHPGVWRHREHLPKKKFSSV